MQVDLHNILLILAYHLIVFIVHKEFSNSIMDKEVLSSLHDNRVVVGLIQRKNSEVKR